MSGVVGDRLSADGQVGGPMSARARRAAWLRTPAAGALLAFLVALAVGQSFAGHAVERERQDLLLDADQAAHDVAALLAQALESLLDDAAAAATRVGDGGLLMATAQRGSWGKPFPLSAYVIAADGAVESFVGNRPRLDRIPGDRWAGFDWAASSPSGPRLLGPLSMSVGQRVVLAVAPIHEHGPAAARWVALGVPLDSLVARSGVAEERDPPMVFELFRTDRDGARPVSLFATQPESLDRPLRMQVWVRGSRFEVAAAPREGWRAGSTGSAARVLGFMLAVGVGVFAHGLFGARLRARAVVVRSRARLARAQQALAREGKLRAEIETRARDRSITDPLTGLPNRATFLRALRRTVSRAAAGHFHGGAVLCIGIDRFSEVNDTLGSDTGDELLRCVSERLFESVRPTDVLARIAPDRFGVALGEGDGPDGSMLVWRRIQQRLRDPLSVGQHEIVTTLSGGMTLVEDGKEDAEELLRNAEMALTLAQRGGQSRILTFDDSLRDRAATSLKLAGDLRYAVDRNELRLAYQPIVRLPDRSVAGMEVLVRWHHPVEGIVSPGLFIPIAEEDGFIVPMNAWILREATKQLHEWRRRGLVADDFYLSVNTSPLEMEDDDYVDSVVAMVAEVGAPPRAIALEVTERLLTRDVDKAARTLERLRDHGFRLLLDDFGTGYSSLAYLYRYRFDGLKIDRAFVAELDRSPWHRSVVRTILSLCDDLEMKAIAEGIETDAVTAALEELGCGFAQGYLFARPVYVEAAEEILRSAAEVTAA